MDFEAMQLLNLSPIPELSELELSTMLEQLSGLSDINGDLTDRNVEDIIKEAEDLLDKSRSSEISISKSKKSPEIQEDKLPVVSTEANVLKDTEEPDTEKIDLNMSKAREKSPAKTDHPKTHSSPNEDSIVKNSNSPAEVTSPKICSPGTSCNHIKSAIDSLKEYSTLVEKKFTQIPSACVKHIKATKQDDKGLQIKSNDQLTEKLINIKPTSKGKGVKTPEAPKKTTSENLDKSIKLLNCFERLYQDRPLRLANCKKPKPVEKIQKVSIKRKLSKEFKNIKKNNRPKSVKRDEEEAVENSVSANDRLLTDSIFVDQDAPRTCENKEDEYFPCTDTLLQSKKNSAEEEEEVALCHLRHSPVNHYQCDGLKSSSSTIDEKLILKVLEEMEEIKDQVRKAGVFSETNSQGVKKGSSENDGMSKSEISTAGGGLESMKNTDIKRLEEQVSNLKEKYDHQMEKLEAENSRLREALNNKLLTPQFVYPEGAEGFPIEKKTFKTSIFNFSSSKDSMDCKTPKNTPIQSPEYIRVVAKEAFAQTERDVRTTSSQCSLEIEPSATRENMEGETKETENKENVVMRKKSGKWKPFSDINVHHLIKQKKVFDHESELLATVRGLQAEMAAKEKENRKLRSEVDSLRRQVNKWTSLKVDTCRKCHIGTQTIGLGPAVQKPYDPENYEAPEEIQKENEELRFRLQALEEDFEMLKEKRINDLQALHQVHEEEMAKLVSKLETQSALTQHLHSLLVNR